MQRTKRAVSLLLSVLLALTCFTCLASVTALAADSDTDSSASFVYGDLDGDGVVKINDATAVQRHLAQQEGFVLEKGTDAFKAADVNGDGEITVDDVTLIQQFLAEFIDHFPVEDLEPPTEETTEAPVEETTEAPVEETTEAPVEETTEEPTTEAAEDVCIVAGAPAEIFGTQWDGANEANTMTKAEDGTYTKDYTVDKAYDAVQLKTVVNGADWVGDKTGNNVTFNLTGEGTFTVVYDPVEGYTYVTGEIVQFITSFEYDTVFAVGNGEGYWLNGAAWDPAYVANEMTETSEDVWEIEFTEVPDGFERQIKFAIDGAWTHNFGGVLNGDEDLEEGGWFDAVYNGDNITFDTDDTCTVTVKLDLTEFDFAAKTGAKFFLQIEYAS